MLEIVLVILKTAGIILVSVLGILIVLAGVVLFVPVRYRGDIFVSDAEDGGKKSIAVKLKITWLLRLVRVYAVYEERLRVRMKVLFFTMTDTAKEKRGRRKRKSDREKDGEEYAGSEREEDGEKYAGSEREEEAKKDRPAEEAVTGWEDERKETLHSDDDREEPARTEEKKGKADKKGGIEARISNILQTIRDFCDKLKGIKEKAERAGTLWGSEHAVNSRTLIGRQLLYLLRHTKPKKLSGYLRFGFDDPSTTGYAMAIYGILYPVWSPELSLEPDFEKQVLDCHILIKGKIRVWHVVRVALIVFFSKDVRRVIKDVREF